MVTISPSVLASAARTAAATLSRSASVRRTLTMIPMLRRRRRSRRPPPVKPPPIQPPPPPLPLPPPRPPKPPRPPMAPGVAQYVGHDRAPDPDGAVAEALTTAAAPAATPSAATPEQGEQHEATDEQPEDERHGKPLLPPELPSRPCFFIASATLARASSSGEGKLGDDRGGAVRNALGNVAGAEGGEDRLVDDDGGERIRQHRLKAVADLDADLAVLPARRSGSRRCSASFRPRPRRGRADSRNRRCPARRGPGWWRRRAGGRSSAGTGRAGR